MAFVRGCSVSLTGTGPDRAGASARRRLVYRAVRNGHRVVMSVKWTERREEEEEDEGEEEQDVAMGKVRAPRKEGQGRKKALIGKTRAQGRNYVEITPAPQLRITGGEAKGRKLKSPDVYMRPMMGKVREALYSILFQFDVLDGGLVVDMFCGSGSVGLEALSRGMDRAVFVDFSPVCTEAVLENVNHCGFENRGEAVCTRVEEVLKRPEVFGITEPARLITLTPPYEEVDYGILMNQAAASDLIGEGTFVVVEYPVELGTLAPQYRHRLVGIRNRRYGRTVLAVYACQPDRDVDVRPEEFIKPI